MSNGDLISQVGRTPLIRLQNVTAGISAEVFVKAEHLNPSGSVKDRAAAAMIVAAEKTGELHRGKTILDATSGNTGIAYAMIGASRGYSVALCLPRNAGPGKKRVLRIYGAEIIETNPLEGTDGAQIMAREMAQRNPNGYFYPDQYNNDANWRAHYEGTGQEIWDQTVGRVTHFLAGLGTSGTFVGTTRKLKEMNGSIHAVSMQPSSPIHGLEGLKHMQSAIVPGIYDPALADETMEVSTEDAQAMTRRLAREEGLFVGASSGANVYAALRMARGLSRDAVVVTILCDGGGRYINDDIWDE